MPIEDTIDALLALPRDQQVAAALQHIDALPPAEAERWNTRFGPGSLFEAWTRTTIARAVHDALADALRPATQRPGFVAIEVGAGDGSMWRRVWRGDESGTLVVIDPVDEAIARVAATAPPGVTVVRRCERVEQLEALPEADVIVCSMTLHHLAGRDAAERARHGLEGPGKREVLARFGTALAPRRGFGLLVEADVDCELHLAPGDPTLRDNLFDSYVRRCARTIVEDLRATDDPALVDAWRALLRHWFLEQILAADVPASDRDVYELRIPQWLELLEQAGLTVQAHHNLDGRGLFELYRFG